MNINEWLEATTGGDSGATIAKRSGLPARTVAHQINTGRMPMENVVAIAIGYGKHPVTALVDTGHLDARYAEQVDPVTALHTVTEEQLADEVLRRMKLGRGAGVFDVPLDQLTQGHVAPVAYEGDLDTGTADDDIP